MLALFVCVQALDSARFLRQLNVHVQPEAVEETEPATNSSSKPITWDSFVGDYCGSYCNMTGVTPEKCTLCAQRMNFTVMEGKVSCQVECQGVQTDRVTEEAVSCSERLDKCMFTKDGGGVDAATCKLECATKSSDSCADKCVAFKQAERAKGNLFSLFYGYNEVATTVEKEVNGTNGTMEMKNVTVMKVEGVEPLPTAVPGAPISPPPETDYRFHVNETEWRSQPKAYCGDFYCNAEAVGVAGVDPYHCVECVNRLNNSVETGLMKCRASCEMKETDAMTGGDFSCGETCLHGMFDSGTCFLECALPMHKATPDCMNACEAAKKEQRAAGAEVRPYGWPEPPSNSTNGTEAEAEEAEEKKKK